MGFSSRYGNEVEPDEPKTVKPKPKNLDEMSIEAIGGYIAELNAEIERAEAAIARKHSARSGAEDVFKS